MCYLAGMSTPQERAARRRAEWTGEVVEPRTPKPPLHAGRTPEERLAAFVELNRRVWGEAWNESSGSVEARRAQRGQWAGTLFEIRRRG